MSRTLPNHPASKCHPPRPRIGTAAPAAGVVVDVEDVVGDGEPVSVGVPVGAELVVAGAEGDVLFVGDDVGVEDCRLLVVGLADGVAVGAFVAVPRLVLVPLPPTVLGGSDAVVGDPAWPNDGPVELGGATFPVVVDAGVVLLVSRRTMIAMIPQAARPAPASTRARRRGPGSGDQAGSPL
jgi:hypothetical protein